MQPWGGRQNKHGEKKQGSQRIYINMYVIYFILLVYMYITGTIYCDALPIPFTANASYSRAGRRRRRRSENSGSFQRLETGWLGGQFLGNRLASSEGAVSNTQLLTVADACTERARAGG